MEVSNSGSGVASPKFQFYAAATAGNASSEHVYGNPRAHGCRSAEQRSMDESEARTPVCASSAGFWSSHQPEVVSHPGYVALVHPRPQVAPGTSSKSPQIARMEETAFLARRSPSLHYHSIKQEELASYEYSSPPPRYNGILSPVNAVKSEWANAGFIEPCPISCPEELAASMPVISEDSQDGDLEYLGAFRTHTPWRPMMQMRSPGLTMISSEPVYHHVLATSAPGTRMEGIRSAELSSSSFSSSSSYSSYSSNDNASEGSAELLDHSEWSTRHHTTPFLDYSAFRSQTPLYPIWNPYPASQPSSDACSTTWSPEEGSESDNAWNEENYTVAPSIPVQPASHTVDFPKPTISLSSPNPTPAAPLESLQSAPLEFSSPTAVALAPNFSHVHVSKRKKTQYDIQKQARRMKVRTEKLEKLMPKPSPPSLPPPIASSSSDMRRSGRLKEIALVKKEFPESSEPLTSVPYTPPSSSLSSVPTVDLVVAKEKEKPLEPFEDEISSNSSIASPSVVPRFKVLPSLLTGASTPVIHSPAPPKATEKEKIDDLVPSILDTRSPPPPSLLSPDMVALSGMKGMKAKRSAEREKKTKMILFKKQSSSKLKETSRSKTNKLRVAPPNSNRDSVVKRGRPPKNPASTQPRTVRLRDPFSSVLNMFPWLDCGLNEQSVVQGAVSAAEAVSGIPSFSPSEPSYTADCPKSSPIPMLVQVQLDAQLQRQSKHVAGGVGRSSLRTGTGSKVLLSFIGPLAVLQNIALLPVYYFPKRIPTDFLTKLKKNHPEYFESVPSASSSSKGKSSVSDAKNGAKAQQSSTQKSDLSNSSDPASHGFLVFVAKFLDANDSLEYTFTDGSGYFGYTGLPQFEKVIQPVIDPSQPIGTKYRLTYTARVFSNNSTVANFNGKKRDLKLAVSAFQYHVPAPKPLETSTSPLIWAVSRVDSAASFVLHTQKGSHKKSAGSVFQTSYFIPRTISDPNTILYHRRKESKLVSKPQDSTPAAKPLVGSNPPFKASNPHQKSKEVDSKPRLLKEVQRVTRSTAPLFDPSPLLSSPSQESTPQYSAPSPCVSSSSMPQTLYSYSTQGSEVEFSSLSTAGSSSRSELHNRMQESHENTFGTFLEATESFETRKTTELLTLRIPSNAIKSAPQSAMSSKCSEFQILSNSNKENEPNGVISRKRPSPTSLLNLLSIVPQQDQPRVHTNTGPCPP
jgi:hypothetical protein